MKREIFKVSKRHVRKIKRKGWFWVLVNKTEYLRKIAIDSEKQNPEIIKNKKNKPIMAFFFSKDYHDWSSINNKLLKQPQFKRTYIINTVAKSGENYVAAKIVKFDFSPQLKK